MRKYMHRVVSILVLVMVASFSIVATTEALSEAEQEKVQGTVAAFETSPAAGMILLESLAEEKPELAIEVIAELAKTMPEVAVMAIAELAQSYPEVAVRGLLRIASDSEKLLEVSPEKAKALEAVIIEAVIIEAVKEMMKETPDIAAVAVVSLLLEAPEIGGSTQDEVIAVSPIAP